MGRVSLRYSPMSSATSPEIEYLSTNSPSYSPPPPSSTDASIEGPAAGNHDIQILQSPQGLRNSIKVERIEEILESLTEAFRNDGKHPNDNIRLSLSEGVFQYHVSHQTEGCSPTFANSTCSPPHRNFLQTIGICHNH